MKILQKISLLSIAILLVIVVALTGNGAINVKKIFDDSQKMQIDMIQNGIHSHFDLQFGLLAMGIEPIIHNEQIIKAFADRDRQRLSELTLPLMDNFERMGVRQFQFHLPNAVSFFRVHKPEEYGDDLSSFRFTVVEANERQDIVQGFEDGVAGVGFRYVVPLSDNGRHIGTVELGMGITEETLAHFKEEYGGEWSLFGIENGQVSWMIGTEGEKESRMTAGHVDKIVANETVSFLDGHQLFISIPLEDYSGEVKWYLEQKLDVSGQLAKERTYFITMIVIGLVISAIGIFVLYYFTRRILKPLSDITENVEKVAAGDLTQEEMRVKTNDEVGILAGSVNEMKNHLKNLIQNIMENAKRLHEHSEMIHENTEQTVQGTEAMVSAIQNIRDNTEMSMTTSDEAARAMEEMTAGVIRVADNATAIAESANLMKQMSEKGNEHVVSAVKQMNVIEERTAEVTKVLEELDENSNEIGEIMSMITGISEQTNLLALNAAIEAARAGEAGKGFAVVADEIRKLADQTRQSAEKVYELISDIQNKADEAVNSMEMSRKEVNEGSVVINEVGQLFSEINKAIAAITEQIEDLSSLAEEMSAGSEQVTASVQELASHAKTMSEDAHHVANASEQQFAAIANVKDTAKLLVEMATKLEESVEKFKL